MYYLDMFTSWETFSHLVWEKYTYNKTRYFVPLLDKRCNQKQYRRRPPPIKNHRIKWHVGVVHQHKVWIRHNDLIQINHCSYCYILSSFDMCRIYLFFMSIGQTKNKLSFLFHEKRKTISLLWRKRDLRLKFVTDCL